MHIFLFDIDGTLINTGGAGIGAFKLAMADQFGVAELSKVPFAGRTDRAIVGDLFLRHGVDNSPENWQRFVEAYVEALERVLPSCQGEVLPGVVRLLQELDDRDDVVIGLLTGNVREGARLKLTHYELFHHFPFGGFGDRHCDRNDVAAEALVAARQFLASEDDGNAVYVVGDTPADIACARAIGAKVVAVATGLPDVATLAAEEPDVLLDDLTDVASVLRLMA
jgi:phosphoglycolate phosphatase